MFGRSKENFWRNTRNDRVIPWNQILSWIFVVVLPLSMIAFSWNIVLRTPKSYLTYLNRSDVMKEVLFQVDEEQISSTFANYMMHREDEFALRDGADYKPQPVFGKRDGEAMKTLRDFVDGFLIVGILCFVAAIAIFIYLYRKEEKSLLYHRVADSRVVMLGMIILLAFGAFLPKIRGDILRLAFGVQFPIGDVLVIFVENQMVQYLAIMIIIVSIIFTVVFWYISWKLLPEKRLFRKRDEFY